MSNGTKYGQSFDCERLEIFQQYNITLYAKPHHIVLYWPSQSWGINSVDNLLGPSRMLCIKYDKAKKYEWRNIKTWFPQKTFSKEKLKIKSDFKYQQIHLWLPNKKSHPQSHPKQGPAPTQHPWNRYIPQLRHFSKGIFPSCKSTNYVIRIDCINPTADTEAPVALRSALASKPGRFLKVANQFRVVLKQIIGLQGKINLNDIIIPKLYLICTLTRSHMWDCILTFWCSESFTHHRQVGTLHKDQSEDTHDQCMKSGYVWAGVITAGSGGKKGACA